uniref:Uncharacterized protein n=1 Tax=Rhizobium leguminosarum TaxID=384 RepID=A0A179BWV6_RHILE|nr:hypothetical protein A4U53_01725 [Rhizobium leguminosarum]
MSSRGGVLSEGRDADHVLVRWGPHFGRAILVCWALAIRALSRPKRGRIFSVGSVDFRISRSSL